jgi:hypothetical protein
MDDIPLQSPVKKGEFSSSSRLLVLQGLVPITAHLVSSQLDAFSARLTDALFKLSDQSFRPDEAACSFQSYQLLKRNNTAFYRLVAGQINAVLAKEVSTVNAKKKVEKDEAPEDFSLVSFDEMESKVLIRNLSQTLEVNNAEQLVALNIRIGNILRRTPINISQNPFRPEVFIRAVYQAWTEFDANVESHHLVLRLIQPELFLQLKPIYDGINDAMIARGILPDLSDAYQSKPKKNEAVRSEHIANRDPYLHDKLRSIFFGKHTHEAGASSRDALQWSGKGYGNGAGGYVGGAPDNAENMMLDRQFFDYLSSIQKRSGRSRRVRRWSCRPCANW